MRLTPLDDMTKTCKSRRSGSERLIVRELFETIMIIMIITTVLIFDYLARDPVMDPVDGRTDNVILLVVVLNQHRTLRTFI